MYNKQINTTLESEDDIEDEFTFDITIEMGATRQMQIEYAVYDTLSLVGTIGGTLGLFVGFSFYDFIAMIIDFLFDKLPMKNATRPGTVPSIDRPVERVKRSWN